MKKPLYEMRYSIPKDQWEWQPWFAWYPVRTIWGKIVWCKSVYRRRVWYSDEKNPAKAYFGWEYDDMDATMAF
jgi:hypothetical protein